jgi:hypothetical protein
MKGIIMNQAMANILAKAAEAHGLEPMTPEEALLFFSLLEESFREMQIPDRIPPQTGVVRCQKVTPTRVRQLTEEDYAQRGGIIQTREGPEAFRVGDYLGHDGEGEYPISEKTIKACYARISAPDAQGWTLYQPKDVRLAIQMSGVFCIQGHRGPEHGQPGDYLVSDSDGLRFWVCAREKFEAEYQLLSLN